LKTAHYPLLRGQWSRLSRGIKPKHERLTRRRCGSKSGRLAASIPNRCCAIFSTLIGEFDAINLTDNAGDRSL